MSIGISPWNDQGLTLHPVLDQVLLSQVVDLSRVWSEDQGLGGLALDCEIHVTDLSVEGVPRQVKVASEFLVIFAFHNDRITASREGHV